MRLFFYLLLTAVPAISARSQDFLFTKHTGKSKPPIDTSLFFKWPVIESPVLSPNGKYVAYVYNGPSNGEKTITVKSTVKGWKTEIGFNTTINSFWFSGDNRVLIISTEGELHFLPTGNSDGKTVIKVKSSKWPISAPGTFIAYQPENSTGDLVLLNLPNRKEIRFSSVSSYRFDKNGNTLILQTTEKGNSGVKSILKWINLPDGAVTEIWQNEDADISSKITSLNFDETGRQLAFMVSSTKHPVNKTGNSVWYYERKMKRAIKKVDAQTEGIKEFYMITGAPRFNKTGKWIFFELQPPVDDRKPNEENADVLVWSYKDLIIQPEQLRMVGKMMMAESAIIKSPGDGPQKYLAVTSVSGKSVTQLERDDELVLLAPEKVTGDFILIKDSRSIGIQDWWKFAPQSSFYIVSLIDGTRKPLKKNVPQLALDNFCYSPGGRYLVFWNCDSTSYFSYDDITGKILNITGKIPYSLAKEPEFTYSYGLVAEAAAPIGGWHRDDSSLLIYDNYDIWQVDPQNKTTPVNITAGLGRKEKIKLQMVDGPGKYLADATSLVIYDSNDTLLLSGFNVLDKSNGFFRKSLKSKQAPERLHMGNYTYYKTQWQMPHNYQIGADEMVPIKAANANIWVVRRQSATEAPNLFITKDFKAFDSLTNFQPQKKFNWLTAELVHWALPNGRMAQGVLYKPEDFDSTKKYPVIFSYYKQLSHQLNEFPYPGYSGENINIPWFVSNGYLVFRPDIHYSMVDKPGRKLVGESAEEAIVSAARYLATFPFVNSKKMGLQGHSVGGGETNYIISHSHVFAAAAEFAGVSDPVSNFLTLTPFKALVEHTDKLSRTETFAGATPWERPDLYTKGSTVLNADKISTPLLITHNEKDNQISGRQGIELYLALRRLGKPVWMLQYTNGNHGLALMADYLDHTIRLTQFFNYYLKDQLPPVWMTEGIPAKLKGIETRYQLDFSGKKP